METCLVIAMVTSILTILVIGAYASFMLNKAINKIFKNVRDISEDYIKTIEDLVDKFDDKIVIVHEEEENEGVTKTHTKVSLNDTVVESNFETKKV